MAEKVDTKAAADKAKMRKTRKGEDEGVNIKVVIRCRPMNKNEEGDTATLLCDAGSSTVDVQQVVARKKTNKKYTFDNVFGPESTQEEVYSTVVLPIVDEVLKGYNCTVFAYGQTGTGKTFTMTGDRDPTTGAFKGSRLAGIIPRTIENIFDSLTAQCVEYTVRVSYLELYNEELNDLLAFDQKTLRIFEDGKANRGICVQNLEEVPVNNSEDIYAILERGSARRQMAATQMNEQSSRSHSIFTITLHMKEATPEGEDLLKVGKLHLVDLAGSENIGRSGAANARAREAGMINQSLLTLGRVINSLVELSPHIPYRESKLTRLLQDSLGGRTKTCIIATVSPALCNVEESTSTLEYANRAKNIRNKPEVNQKMTKRMLIKEYTEEIELLKQELQSAREKDGVYLPAERFTKMESTIQAQTEQLAALTTAIQAKETVLEELKATNNVLEVDLQSTRAQFAATKAELVKTTDALVATTEELGSTKVALEEEQVLVGEHVSTERTLESEARAVTETLKSTISDIHGLHGKIERKATVEHHNKGTTLQFKDAMEQKIEGVKVDTASFRAGQFEHFAHVERSLEENATVHAAQFGQLRAEVGSLLDLVLRGYESAKQASGEYNATIGASSSDFRAASTSHMSAFETHSQQMVDLVVGTVRNIGEGLARLEQTVIATTSGFKSSVQEGLALTNAFAVGQQEFLSSMRGQLAVHAEQQVAFLAAQQATAQQMQQNEEARAAQLQASMLSDMAALFQKYNAEHAAIRGAQVTQVTSDLAAHSADIEQNAAQFAITTNTALATVESFASAQSNNAASLCSLMDSAVEGQRGAMGEMVAASNAFAETAKSHVDQGVQQQAAFGSASTAFVSTVTSHSVQYDASLNAAVNASSEQVKHGVASVTAAIATAENSGAATADERRAEVAQQKAAVIALEQAMESNLSGVSSVTGSYVHSLKEDIPTGTTPAKRNVDVPLRFTVTRPREEVLQQYRASKSAAPTQHADAGSDEPVTATVAATTAVDKENVVPVATGKTMIPRPTLHSNVALH